MGKLRQPIDGLDLVDWSLNEIECEAVQGIELNAVRNADLSEQLETIRLLAKTARAELLAVAQKQAPNVTAKSASRPAERKGVESC